MDNKRTTILAFVAVAVMLAVCFIGFAVIGDEVSDADTGKVAKIGDEEYDTLAAAVAAVKDGETIYLLKNVTDGTGISTKGGISFTIDFGTYTYTFKSTAAGSVGTETQGFQFKQSKVNGDNSKITLQNGTLNVDESNRTKTRSEANPNAFIWLINSYVNLDIIDMTIDGTNLNNQSNDGKVGGNDTIAINMYANDLTITNSTITVDYEENYGIAIQIKSLGQGYTDDVNAEIKSGTIYGPISVGKDTDKQKFTMSIDSGSFTDIVNAVKYVPDNAVTAIKLAKTIGTEKAPISKSIDIVEDKNIILDLNGFAIYSQASKVVNNMGTLTICNGSIFQYGAGYTAIKNFANGVLTIENLDVTVVTAQGGHTGIAVKQDDFDKEGGSLVTDPKGSITINSGTFTAGQAIQAWGEVTIEGGTFNGQITAITCKGDNAGNIAINGGTINSDIVSVSYQSGKEWTGSDGQSSVIVIDADNVKMKAGISIMVGYVTGSTTNFVAQSEYPKESGSIPTVLIKGVLPSNVSTNASVSITSTSEEGVEMTGYLAFFEDAVKALNKAGSSGEAKITLLKNITAVDSGVTNQAAFWFTNSSMEITIDGNDYVITYNATKATDNKNERFNVIGFGDGMKVSIEDLKIKGDGKARNGINIYQSESITIDGLVIENIKMAGIVANGCTLEVNDCDLGLAGGYGGINIANKGAKLTVDDDGLFIGSIWSETNDVVTVTYDDAVTTMTCGKSTCWFSYGNDDVAECINYYLNYGNVTMTGDLVLDKKTIAVPKDKKFTISEGATFTGTIVGPQTDGKDNTLVANGLKAGVGGISVTGGSLIINGKIMTNGSSEAGVTVKVSGKSIEITGTLEKGATMEIESDTTVTITNGTTFASNGTITNSGKIVNEGTMTNTGTLKMTDESTITGSVVNNGIVADKRDSGSDAVIIDTSSKGGVVVTEKNADAYKDQKDVTVIVEDTETVTTEGTIAVDSNTYVFVNAVTTTGKLKIVMNGGEYVITIPAGTEIPAATIMSITQSGYTSESIKYDVDTNGIANISLKLPCQSGFKSAKVYCNGLDQYVSNVKYNSSQGYVTFDTTHNSTFTIVLSNATPSSGTSDAIDENTAFVGAIVVLVVAILALAVVIKRK